MTNKFLTVPAKTSHTASVIFLHGLGDSGHGWESVASMLSPQLSHVKWILPHAPSRRVTCNFGSLMPAWYDIYSLDADSKEDEAGMLETVSLISKLVQFEIDAGISPKNIVVAGFSQGAAMSLLYGLNSDIQIGGIAALSGYLPLAKRMHVLRKKENIMPIFMGHGIMDDVVQFQWGKKSEEQLKTFGLGVEFKSYKNLGHSASEEEFLDLLMFLKKIV